MTDSQSLEILPARGRGREPAEFSLEYVRDISPEDLTELVASPPPGAGFIPPKTLRHRHHTLAQLVASGLRPMECAAASGYSVPYVSSLSRDPAFQELVAFYAEEAHREYLNVHSRLAALGTTAVELLRTPRTRGR